MAAATCSISFSLTDPPSSRMFISSDDQNDSTTGIAVHFLGHTYDLGRSIQILGKKKITFSAEKENFNADKVTLFVSALRAFAETTNKHRVVQKMDPKTYLFDEHGEHVEKAAKEVTAAKEALEKTVIATGISYTI